MTQQAGSVDCVAALVEKERCVAGAGLGWATHRSLAQSRSGAPAKKVGGRESGLTANSEETRSWCFEIRNPAPNVLSTPYTTSLSVVSQHLLQHVTHFFSLKP
ncbi:hypothetical protein E4U56_007472 [Claviceps arundinis]|uniref:Uncharacterized protein n=1 Tax=Claviceps arundinis TaxID=1623583 RepID=A0A9P7SRU7_9HYPO|nr:hypothetical protein E4U56_007472 [Claviceps arundinis]